MNDNKLESVLQQLSPAYQDADSALILGDNRAIMAALPPNSIDMVFADPPYFLSDGGRTCSGGKAICVNKGDWDKIISLEEVDKYNIDWIQDCYRVLVPGGSIWVSGTHHNIGSVIQALKKAEFTIRNAVIWEKTNPPPNLSCRSFTHSNEIVVWATKAGRKYTFNYHILKEKNGGKQMKDIWSGPVTPRSEKIFGKHPTQKPIYLLDTIVRATSLPNDIVLDPFCGSSTTGVACKRLGRNFIGIDQKAEYIELSANRLAHENMNFAIDDGA